MHQRRPHADLLAELFDFLLAVGLEQGFHAAELLFFPFSPHFLSSLFPQRRDDAPEVNTHGLEGIEDVARRIIGKQDQADIEEPDRDNVDVAEIERVSSDVGLVVARLLLDTDEMQAHGEANENVDDGHHGRLDHTPEQQERDGVNQETIWRQSDQETGLVTAAGVDHAVLFRDMEGRDPPEGNQRRDGVTHLMRKYLYDVDVLLQEAVHQWEDDGTQKKPQAPHVDMLF